MVKRATSAALWFLAIGWGFNYISVFTGISPTVGLVLGVAVATLIGVDPMRLIWPPPAAVTPSETPEPVTVVGSARIHA